MIMKRQLLTALAACLLCGSAAAQLSDVAASNMYGKVKSCTFTEAKYTHSEGDDLFFDENPKEHTEFYDQQGYLTAKDMGNGERYTYKTTYAAGVPTLIMCYEADGSVGMKTVFRKQGAGTLCTGYNARGRVTEKLLYKGNDITLTAPTSDMTVTMTLNAKKQVVAVVCKAPYGITTQSTYHYNEHGALEKVVTNLKRTLGTRVEEYTHYEYDSHGNWTSRIKWVDDDPVMLEEREIEYYPLAPSAAKKKTTTGKAGKKRR